MLIAGIQKMTMLDYPDRLAALIFTQGCNFACGYCHNPEMIPKLRVLDNSPDLEPEAVLAFLKTRVGLLDGVVISGGEPTLQPDLEEFIRKIKALGFLVKLDTNGSHPEILKKLIDEKLIDYIAMDLKHTQDKYAKLAKYKNLGNIMEAIRVVMNSGIDYEFRSTILPYYHSKNDLDAMGEMIRGANKWYLQNFRSLKTLDKKLQKKDCYSQQELNHFKEIASKYVGLAELRV